MVDESLEGTDAYYEAFGKRIMRLTEQQMGKVPSSLGWLAKQDGGLQTIGKMSDKELKEKNDPNYGMLRMMALSDAEKAIKG